MKSNHPTPHPDVNEILNVLFTKVTEILQDQLIGMYLFGSLANGDFDEHSDIDVLFVTNGKISEDKFSSLRQMHADINKLDSPWAIQIEASYIPKDALRHYDPQNNVHPHMDRGSNEVLHMMMHATDWIVQRFLLRENGIVITGPDLKTLIDPVSTDDLRWAVARVLPLWVDPMLEDPSKIDTRGYQSFIVLSLCRMLYTLQKGEILTKPAAAEWGKQNLDPEWTPLIERALVGRQNPNLHVQPEDLQGTLEMMRYTLQQTKPTPYAEVNLVLNMLLANVKQILGDQFVGMYLYGSLSSGDFNTETSDIDFLVVTKDNLPEQTITALESMHKHAWATSLKRAGQLEGSYVPKDLIRKHDPNGLPCPTVNEGQFFVDQRGSDWIIQRHVVREFGVIVEGPDPKTLIDYVGPDDIRGAVMGILHEWWFPMLDDPTWLREHDDHYRAFAVITMCRVMHALKDGTVISKPRAVQWAQAQLGEPWKTLIDKAIAASNHETAEVPLDETLGFIRHTMETVRHGDDVELTNDASNRLDMSKDNR